MKQALAKKLEELKAGSGKDHGLEVEINLGHDDDKDESDDKGSDLAPDISKASPASPLDPSSPADPSDPSSSTDDDQHMQILKGISDAGHSGRGAMGLKERAAAGAKEKIAALMASKGKKA